MREYDADFWLISVQPSALEQSSVRNTLMNILLLFSDIWVCFGVYAPIESVSKTARSSFSWSIRSFVSSFLHFFFIFFSFFFFFLLLHTNVRMNVLFRWFFYSMIFQRRCSGSIYIRNAIKGSVCFHWINICNA